MNLNQPNNMSADQDTPAHTRDVTTSHAGMDAGEDHQDHPAQNSDVYDSRHEQSHMHDKHRRKHKRRRIRAVAVLPSLFTLGNLIAGFAAIHYASKPLGVESTIGPFQWSSMTMAGALIFIGMLCDAVDGSVARLTRSVSDIGGQLDSLADIVTFGVAPAYLTLRLVSMSYLSGSDTLAVISPDHDDAFARIFWVIAAIYVCCTALRLARFNVEAGPEAALDDHKLFRGLPSPGAAGCLAALILLHEHRIATLEVAWAARATGVGMAAIMLLCALAMVSRLPYVHAANRYVRGDGSFGYLVKAAIILIFVVFYTHEALAIGFTAYALSAPSRSLLRLWQRKLKHKKRNRHVNTTTI